VDFSHTAALSDFQFLVNGAAADPSAIDIVSGTLRMTSAGIQDTAVPEPGTLVLFGGGLIAFGFLKRRERPRPSCQ
ncbi:MAG TPA: PEP-CTERM sorting domain-containing protein, partial [Bryobacteraceae bacterium]|nr:PEP-CTERM sorting domain-containing protein [Bryobacteraceae bacterium]